MVHTYVNNTISTCMYKDWSEDESTALNSWELTGLHSTHTEEEQQISITKEELLSSVLFLVQV